MDSSNKVLITDFGSSKVVEGSEGATGTQTGMMGTLFFMSPEVAHAWKWWEVYSYDPFAADMWSLGITLYLIF